MTRKTKAALLTLATPAPTDREKMWAAMRQEKSFTQARIAGLAGVNKSKVQDYLKGLTASGFVVKRESAKRTGNAPNAPFAEAMYDMARDTGVDAPRVRPDGTVLPASGRGRMWNAMRVLKVFTVAELVNAASLPEAPVAIGEAQTYCAWLARGGYLAGGAGVWRFIPAKFTGAKAPQILRVKALFDPNLGTVVYSGKPEGRDDE